MGQIVLTIITLRSLDANHLPAPEVFATAVCRAALAAQEDYEPLAKEWADTSALTGHPVVVALLPRGETRGTVTGLAPDGRLRLVSATGMVELLAVGAVRNVNLA